MEFHMNNYTLHDSSGHHTISTSSSSSIRSLSYDDYPIYSPLIYDIPTAISHDPDTTTARSTFFASVLIQYQQAIQTLSRIRNVHIPTIESEDAAIVNAITAVLSSSSVQPKHISPPAPVYQGNTSAFKVYNRQSLLPKNQISVKNHKVNLINRSIMFLRTMMNTSSGKDLHHILYERKRREKLNESFQALRSFLPAPTKKDKASVLSVAADYLTILKDQISELSKSNQTLEIKLLSQRSLSQEEMFDSLNQRLDIGIMHLGESSSKASRLIELQIIMLGETSIVDMVISILQFLKDDQKMSLMSMEASTNLVDSTPMNWINFRLKIEGMEWEEYAFQEAVRRVVSQ